MARLRGIALVVRLALLALASMSAVPAAAAAQEVLCDPNEVEVRSLHFVGNNTFSKDELSARVLTTPSSSTRRLLLPLGARRCYPDIGLLNDVTNLKAFYRNNGFYDTRVDTVVTKRSGNRVDITFLIAEGRPLILDSLAITGLDSLPGREEVLRDSVLKVGERAGLLQIYAQRDTLITRLRNAGYPTATAFLASETHPTEHSVEVSIDVQPGTRARFGHIAVNSMSVKGGPPEVRDSVVMRLLGLRRGELYSDRALAQATRNLYNLALFRHVDVALDTMFTHGDSIADILVDLREDFMRQIDLEEGWGQLDCFKVNGLYTDKNFRDRAQALQFTARVSKLAYAPPSADWSKNLCYRHYLDNDSLASSKLNTYLGVSVRYPTLSLFSFTPAYSVYTERQGQYQAYLRTTDVGLGVSGTKDITARTNMRLGYNFEHGKTQAEPVILCGLFNRCTVEEQDDVQDRLALGVASAALQRVTTDNLVVPTRGYRTGLEVRYSAPFLGSNPTLNFFKITANYAWYRQLRRGVVFAANSTGGVIFGGQTIEGTRLPPPQERLYAGGPTSMRGYQQNQLGPQVYLLNRDQLDSTEVVKNVSFFYTSKVGARQDRSIPGGGNLLALLNAELRIRDPFFPDLLEYAPFIDAGQVWATQISTNVTRQPIAWAPGLAVRYFSPVGPILVNVGYNRYPPTAGPAYFLTGAGEGTRPLICVTNPGDTPILVTRTPDGLVQDNARCPANFTPPSARNFFQRLTFTISIGTAF